MKYDNLLVIGDLNIDTLNKKKNHGNYFSDRCDSFSLKNLMTNITCIKSIIGSSIDVTLANKIRSFHHTSAFESGLSDCHKMMLTFFRTHFKYFFMRMLNTEISKAFTEMISSINLILNLAKKLFINLKITSLKS